MPFAAFAIILAVVVMPGPGLAAPALPPDLSVRARLEIAAVSADGILTAETGEAVVPAGVRLPARLEQGAALQPEAVRFLRDQCVGREAALLSREPMRDRWGRYLAHLRVGDEWIQAALVAAGLAVVEGRAGRDRGIDALLVAERDARRRDAGVWGTGFRVFSAAEEMPTGRFAVVAGRIVDAATVNGRTYLNFGENWRRDFTVILDKPALRRFQSAGFEPESLVDAEVRVRGVLEEWNGPLIRLQRPGQMEVLSRPAPANRQGP